MDKINNMSLKKAFFVLTLSSLIIASTLTTFSYILLNNLYNSIQDKYLKTPINTGFITIVQNNVNQFSDYDKTLLNIINILQLVLPLIFFIGLLLLADIIFYKELQLYLFLEKKQSIHAILECQRGQDHWLVHLVLTTLGHSKVQ